MCGICGVFAYGQDAGFVSEGEVTRVRDSMRVRGPDGSGSWISADRRVGLAHRRLAIIDLSPAGAQPMADASGELRVVFNGEIYNHRELRSELEARGCRFFSNSDTEVLLHLYREKGPDMVESLRGMYAFALWDNRKRGLLLVRDPFGIKPLYYADDGKTLRFASQVKALLRSNSVDDRPDPAGQVGYFLWGHVPEPFTLYRGIRGLAAGSTLWVDEAGGARTRKFCDIAQYFRRQEEMKATLRESLLDSVRHHLIADVPVGVFLSSGLDSSTIVALASESSSHDLHTLTLGFAEYRGTVNDEVPLAEKVATHYSTRHSTLWLSAKNFHDEWERLLNSMDQPSIDGVNTFFVAKVAAQSGFKVALSGIGGDELFGGYSSFARVPALSRTLRPLAPFPVIGRGFRRVTSPWWKRSGRPKMAGLLEYGGNLESAYLLSRSLFMPWELLDFLDAELVQKGWNELQPILSLQETTRGIRSDHCRISALEMSWYMRNQLLRDADWAGMAHSLEIRVPFVDIELLKLLGPAMANGSVSKRAMAATPRRALPREVLERQKTGFSIPVRSWLGAGAEAGQPGRGLRAWAKTVFEQQARYTRAA
jgi:asparagine synthase (glutamine-hydrolysing)